MPDTRFFHIHDLARMFGITARTIRYYEELGLIAAEERGETAHRRYAEHNAVRLKRVQQLKDYGLTLTEIRELFGLAAKDRTGASVRALLAAKYRSRLDEARRKRERLDEYIDDLSWHVEQLEEDRDFFECPGLSCHECRWAERCDVRLLFGEKA